MTAGQRSTLFAEFEPATSEEWLAATQDSLRGRHPDTLIKRLYEGFDIHPLTCAAELDGIAHLDRLPGQYPFVRGTEAAGYRAKPWLIAQDLDLADPLAFNQALKQALAHGQTAVYLGTNLKYDRIDDMRTAFAGINLSTVPLLLADETPAIKMVQLLCACLDERTLTQLKGCMGYDPLQGLAKSGGMAANDYEGMAEHIRTVNEASPQLGSVAVRTDIYHDAGANAVQELALAMASAVLYLREMLSRDLDVDLVAGKLHFFLSVGENFFLEVAKLRAVKLLWAQIVRAFGGAEEAQKIKLHVRGGRRNKTRLDAHVNMLRATTEALAAAIGGVDSISVAPFDAPLGSAGEFTRRIARNIQLILQEELQLIKLIDPSAGAWHVEKLTDQLAQAAWRLFQNIEEQGGLVEALKAGTIQAQIEAVAQKRRDDVMQGRAVLVGSSKYPNLEDSILAEPAPQQEQKISSEGDHIKVTPLKAIRLAAPYEALRRNAEHYQRQKGHLPRLLLLALGEPQECNSRLDSARDIYEVGGFESIDGGGYTSVDAALQASLQRDAAAVVLCVGDDGIERLLPNFVRELKAAKPDLILILAADPADRERYRHHGVDEFMPRDADYVVLNQTLQRRLGFD